MTMEEIKKKKRQHAALKPVYDPGADYSAYNEGMKEWAEQAIKLDMLEKQVKEKQEDLILAISGEVRHLRKQLVNRHSMINFLTKEYNYRGTTKIRRLEICDTETGKGLILDYEDDIVRIAAKIEELENKALKCL